ncbi:MAG TPA: 50S ribosomal protein L25 [Geobacteraceae bacterium]|nr:50S ribosomal protein L25 [Geobacteraceae bacterium]
MKRKELTVELRDKTGKGISRQLRNRGLVPGVVYGKGMDAVSVSVNSKELSEAIAGEGGHNNLLTLKGCDALDGNVVIVADIVLNPLKRSATHVDLHKISMTEKIKVAVPINLVGTAAGVSAGGLLDLAKHTLEVECLPTQIPEHIDVDVTELTVGHSIHVGDLKIPEGLKVLDDSRASVVSILGKSKEEGTVEAAAETAAE